MNSIEIDSIVFAVLIKLLKHSYIGVDGRLGTYPPFELTLVEREWFQKYKETGELRRQND